MLQNFNLNIDFSKYYVFLVLFGLLSIILSVILVPVSFFFATSILEGEYIGVIKVLGSENYPTDFKSGLLQLSAARVSFALWYLEHLWIPVSILFVFGAFFAPYGFLIWSKVDALNRERLELENEHIRIKNRLHRSELNNK